MKKGILCLFLLFQSIWCFAGHIAGGEIYYRYVGPGSSPGTSVYVITLRLFRECNPVVVPGGPGVAELPSSVPLNIYNNVSPATQYGPQHTVNWKNGGYQTLSLSRPNPCISNPPEVCYQVAYYETTQELPNTAGGYIIAFQTCCRTVGLNNVQVFDLGNGSQGEGATYSCEIPGTSVLPTGNNSSAVFAVKDTSLICKSTPFTLDFSATDPDQVNGDSLSYSFCSAYDRGNTINSASINYSSPPFNTVSYLGGYSGATPLGDAVTINPVTGIISGKAPDGTGPYVVNVCVTEWRQGVPISVHRKDFILKISDCSLTAATLKPSYITCNGYTLAFENQSTSSSVSSYLWNFGEANVTPATSTDPTPTHTYQDTGTYVLKLKVTSTSGCQDSTTAPVKIYPGFTPDFTVKGSCYINAYQFFDATVTKYGVVNSWKWDLGDSTTTADTATSKDTSWRYQTPRSITVRLTSTNSKGCIDTVSKTVIIADRPSIQLAFHDTLICSIDSLPLKATISGGSFTWTPSNAANLNRVININTLNPVVYPTDTTIYKIDINDNGCVNSDSVKVNVLPYIKVDAGADSGICKTDTFHLHPISQALSYQWTSSTGVPIDNIKYPLVQPLVNTTYYILANLGKCQDRDSVHIAVTPYPVAKLGSDTVICFGNRIQLNGNIVGTTFTWSPTGSLLNFNTLHPFAAPSRNTQYILTVKDTIGCPKSFSDTMNVMVIPTPIAYAGRDTSILPNQPLQLSASGGLTYTWTPATGLNNAFIYDPVAILSGSTDSVRYVVRVTDQYGCYADDDVMIHVFKTGSDIFVPTAFTPNGDGKNDVLKPFTVGISQLLFFKVYNRWGQLIFYTTELNKGWDGTFEGVKQPSGTYVFETSGIDISGHTLLRKGTTVLIR